MTNVNRISPILFIFFIQQSMTQIPPVVPLTNALTAVYCHNFNDIGMMTIRCGANEKIRMLDAFDVAVKNKSHLPLQCSKQKYFSMVHGDIVNEADCKVHTSFTSACSGRENCTLHMQRLHLNSANDHCHNQLVDYTMAFFECVSDVFIHDICSTQAITSAWGTLKTPNFPNPYTSNDDCWCKLSTQLHHRLLLSVIIFQLIPYDQKCAGAGLYLQSSEEQRSTQCTYLQPGHNYLSDTNSLYINFYSRTSTVRGGFWIIYEASQTNAEVHLQCGSREKLGVPYEEISISPPPISSSYNHGWSRLVYNDPPNPTTIQNNDHIMHMGLIATTRLPPFLNKRFRLNPLTTAASAFTYPYGRLTTFELAYGPRGWFVKYPFGLSNMTATKFLQRATTLSPVEKWNSTWRYIRRLRTRVFQTITSSTATTKTTMTTTVSTTIISTQTATLESTTIVMPTSTAVIITTEQSTIPISSTVIPTSTLESVTIHGSFSNTKSLTMIGASIKSSIYLPVSSRLLKTTLPSPTPWYPPAGLFDWWQRQRHTTKLLKVSFTTIPTTPTVISSMQTTTAMTTITTTITTARITTVPPTTTTTSVIHLSNTTSKSVATQKTDVTVDWFKWPSTQTTLSTKGRYDYDADEYLEWSDYFATRKLQTVVTISPLGSILSEPQRKQYQQLSLLPIIPNLNGNNLGRTMNTPSSKRDHTQHNIDTVGKRNTSAENQPNEGIPHTNGQNVIEQLEKKNSEEYGWFSKTDITIVAVSILFVVLLVFINLILFAVRRHRHRIQGRHLLCASFPSTINGRSISNNQLQSSKLGDSTNSLINITNNNNNDILPAVGEIVLWDEKDQGGYMIDNHGEWAKIEGRQWLGNDILTSGNKTSFSKSFRSRLQFIRQSNKKSDYHHQRSPTSPKAQQHQQQQQLHQQQTLKFPLLMDTTTLSPVPEADDYQSSDFSSSEMIIRNAETKYKNSDKKHHQAIKAVQALIHTEQDHSDEYYKRIGSGEDESNYSTMHENIPEEYSIADQQMNRSLGHEIDAGGSVIISVPTMLRREDDMGATTDGGESIYNQNYSIRSFIENTHPNYHQITNPKLFSTKQPTRTNNPIIIGHCQTDFQPLNPKLLEKSLLADNQQFYSCSRSMQFSTYDSGFFDDQTMNSLTVTPTNERMSTDDTSSSRSNDNLSLNGLSRRNFKKAIRQKQKHIVKL